MIPTNSFSYLSSAKRAQGSGGSAPKILMQPGALCYASVRGGGVACAQSARCNERTTSCR